MFGDAELAAGNEINLLSVVEYHEDRGTEWEMQDYMLGYCSKFSLHYYSRGVAPNESDRRYWLGYKDLAEINSLCRGIERNI